MSSADLKSSLISLFSPIQTRFSVNFPTRPKSLKIFSLLLAASSADKVTSNLNLSSSE